MYKWQNKQMRFWWKGSAAAQSTQRNGFRLLIWGARDVKPTNAPAGWLGPNQWRYSQWNARDRLSAVAPIHRSPERFGCTCPQLSPSNSNDLFFLSHITTHHYISICRHLYSVNGNRMVFNLSFSVAAAARTLPFECVENCNTWPSWRLIMRLIVIACLHPLIPPWLAVVYLFFLFLTLRCRLSSFSANGSAEVIPITSFSKCSSIGDSEPSFG